MQDLGIGGSAFPLARTQRRCIAICEDLPHLSGGEVRQSGKSRFTATLRDSLKEMGAYNHGPGHRLEMCQARNGKNGDGKETGKERVLSFPVPPFLGTHFFPVSGQNH